MVHMVLVEVAVEVAGHRLRVALVAPLEALASAQEGAVVEHVLAVGVQRPVVAFARVAGLAGHLDKAVVEREVVPYAVLPGGEALLVVGELVHDEVADAAQRQSLLARLQNGHGDQGDVAVGWLDQVLPFALRLFAARRRSLLGRRRRLGVRLQRASLPLLNAFIERAIPFILVHVVLHVGHRAVVFPVVDLLHLVIVRLVALTATQVVLETLRGLVVTAFAL